MQWNIGVSKGSIEQIIRNKMFNLSFTWLPLNNNTTCIADPFLIREPGGDIYILYEDFSMVDPAKYGKIVWTSLDKNLISSGQKELLDTGIHASYPFVFVENDKTYVIPETSRQNKVSCYEYDFINKCLINEKILINHLPLLDSTIFKYNEKYWLFATQGAGGLGHSTLYIYYADHLFGKYKPHVNNPVKNNLDGSRPAGHVIKVDGALYRPAQNCGKHYGESITINKITTLSETEFSEEIYLKIVPDKNSRFKSGIHTINVVDDIIVIDGIRMIFMPLTKGFLFIKKMLRINS